MKFELFIANRLKTNKTEGDKNSSTPSLSIAVSGMTLAIAIMILSLTIVCGFKHEISSKIYNLDAHIKIILSQATTTPFQISGKPAKKILNQSLFTEKSTVLKTANDFKGIIYKGVDNNYNWSYLQNNLIEGTIPTINDTINRQEAIISKIIADELNIKTGDKVLAYFIEKNVKARNIYISGIYSTGLSEYDKSYIIGNINTLKNIDNTTSYIGLNCFEYSDIESTTNELFELCSNNPNITSISNTSRNNISYFTWLNLLDTNVLVIIIIMLSVTTFTLISGMLMIVLERINMIGILKTMGATDSSIRKTFIFLTNKLIIKALILGNIIGLSLSFIQQKYQIVKLDSDTYYIPHVPIEIDWKIIILLNVGILVTAYFSLLMPSHIISKIKPHESIRFE